MFVIRGDGFSSTMSSDLIIEKGRSLAFKLAAWLLRFEQMELRRLTRQPMEMRHGFLLCYSACTNDGKNWHLLDREIVLKVHFSASYEFGEKSPKKTITLWVTPTATDLSAYDQVKQTSHTPNRRVECALYDSTDAREKEDRPNDAESRHILYAPSRANDG